MAKQSVKEYTEEEFKALPIREQRVLIAKDVVARVMAATLLPKNATLIGIPDGDFFARGEILRAIDKEYVNSKVCTVCAKGAIACSWMGAFNTYNARQFDTVLEPDADITDVPGNEVMLALFGRPLLDAMECAFELRTSDLLDIGWHADTTKILKRDIEITFYGNDDMFAYLNKERELGWDEDMDEDYPAPMDATVLLLAIYNNIITNNGVMILHNGVTIE